MDLEALKEKIRGVDIVLITPFEEDGALDLEGLRENVNFLVEEIEGKDFILTPVGSTGEFYALSEEEHKAVIKAVVEEVAGRVPVFAGTAQAATPQTVAMCRYAEEVGADGLQLVLPYYHIPTNEGMYEHFKAVADAVDIGIKIYNNPAVSSSWIDSDLMARLSEIENIIGLKENTPHITYYRQMIRTLDPAKIATLCGLGEVMYSFEVVYGCLGFVTWIGNFAPQLSYRVYEAGESRDMDRLLQAIDGVAPLDDFVGKMTAAHAPNTSALPAPDLMGGTLYVSVAKAAMDLMGLHGGPPRLPLVSLTGAEKDELGEILDDLDLL
ncbi:MAG: dihydrodipicolinate synthase family protein [Anaerolineales bacterium]